MHILNLIKRKLYPNRWLGCMRSAVRYITAHKQSLLFWSRLFTTEPKYPKGCCPHDLSLTACFYENPGNGFPCRCDVRVSCKEGSL